MFRAYVCKSLKTYNVKFSCNYLPSCRSPLVTVIFYVTS